jgi:hypothetical protein
MKASCWSKGSCGRCLHNVSHELCDSTITPHACLACRVRDLRCCGAGGSCRRPGRLPSRERQCKQRLLTRIAVTQTKAVAAIAPNVIANRLNHAPAISDGLEWKVSTTSKILAVMLLPIALQGCGVVPIPFPGLGHYAWRLSVAYQYEDGTNYYWQSELWFDEREQCEKVAAEIEEEYSAERCTIIGTSCRMNIVGKSALYPESHHLTPILHCPGAAL